MLMLEEVPTGTFRQVVPSMLFLAPVNEVMKPVPQQETPGSCFAKVHHASCTDPLLFLFSTVIALYSFPYATTILSLLICPNILSLEFSVLRLTPRHTVDSTCDSVQNAVVPCSLRDAVVRTTLHRKAYVCNTDDLTDLPQP